MKQDAVTFWKVFHATLFLGALIGIFFSCFLAYVNAVARYWPHVNALIVDSRPVSFGPPGSGDMINGELSFKYSNDQTGECHSWAILGRPSQDILPGKTIEIIPWPGGCFRPIVVKNIEGWKDIIFGFFCALCGMAASALSWVSLSKVRRSAQ